MMGTEHLVLGAMGAFVAILALAGYLLSTGDPYSDQQTERGDPPSPHGEDW